MRNTLSTRVVIGGGVFGCFAAMTLADLGHDVQIIEQDSQLMTRASFVNQARLHTGLHYPRSLITARESFSHYREFRTRWPQAVRDFTQIYAVAANNSKTSGSDFADFIERLGISTVEIDPNFWFHSNTVSRAFRVEEPSFDAQVLRNILTAEIASRANISVLLNTAVTGGEVTKNGVMIRLNDGQIIDSGGVVIAAYAATNAVRQSLGLAHLPLVFELTELILGNVTPDLQSIGFTIMDGPFWSLMPFGHGNLVSLSSVGLTPLQRSRGLATFPCQSIRGDCTPLDLKSCTSCFARPTSALNHQLQQMKSFLKKASDFTPKSSLYTIKAILSGTEVDDARPTLVYKEYDEKVFTVFSGKVSTLFDLEKELK